MLTLRRISQIFFLLLFFILFLLASYPLTSRIPVDFFLRLDPLLWLSTTFAAKTFVLHSIPPLILLLLTVLLGRFFCGWICPLGTVIDGSDRVIHAQSRNTSVTHFRWVKMGVLVVILLAALFSVQFAGFMDPIPLFTRTTVTFLYPFFVLAIETLFGIFLLIGFIEEYVFHIHESLRGFLIPIQATSFRSSVLVALIFIMILAFGYVYRRFWCRNLCPLGALLGIFSKHRWYRRRVSDDCTDCGLCRKNCRMDAIYPDYRTTNHVECITCMDCQKICPVDAIDFGFVSKPKSTPVNFSRRHFLTAGATGLLSVGLIKVGYANSEEKGFVIRPPGSREETDFLNRCIRCGECIRICSTSGAGLHYAALESGWEGIWTPVLLPKAGYCEYNCNLCTQVCPTGAIHPLDLEEKQNIRMGTAHFDKTRCIPWYYGEDCLVCEEHCPLPEKAIKFRDENTITIDGKETKVLLPYVDETLCIGCGICVTKCPLEGEKGIYLTNLNEERWFD